MSFLASPRSTIAMSEPRAARLARCPPPERATTKPPSLIRSRKARSASECRASAWSRSTCSGSDCPAGVKYPPAEPGALRFEPLEAAVAASHVTLIGLIASPQHWKQPLLAPSRALTNRTSFAPCFASAACVYLPIKARERSRCTRSRSGRPTPGNVKLPLPPRQSRGNSRYISRNHSNLR